MPMKDTSWHKLLKNEGSRGYDILQAILQMQPTHLTPEQCVEECRHALHNWTVTAVHETKTGLPQWATPIDAINAWQEALEYWEAKCQHHSSE